MKDEAPIVSTADASDTSTVNNKLSQEMFNLLSSLPAKLGSTFITQTDDDASKRQLTQ